MVKYLIIVTVLTGFISGGCTTKAGLVIKNQLISENLDTSGVDTSFVYQLPFEKGKSYLMVQDYYTKYTHSNRAALDFQMKKGTPVMAARSGIVMQTKDTGKKGGYNRKYREHANYVLIRHDDNTVAGYWHLQFKGVKVQPGDTVQAGSLIGYSGKTGMALTPHLHFFVMKSENNRRKTIATRFHTLNDTIYLKALKKYRNPKK